MMSIFTRLFTLFSFAVLLVVAQVGMRAYEWSHSKSLIRIESPFANLISLDEAKNVEVVVAKSHAQEAYDSQKYELPKYEERVVQRLKKSPKIQFKRIDKSINIFEEAWGELEIGTAAEGEWREIRGDVSIPNILEIEAEKIDTTYLESTQMVALFDGFQFKEDVMVVEVEAPIKNIVPTDKIESQELKIIEDEVKLTSAKSVELDPEFFEYEADIATEELAGNNVKAQEREIVTQKKVESFDYPTATPELTNIDQAKITQESLEFFNLIEETKMPAKTAPKKKVENVAPKLAMTSQSPKENREYAKGLVADHNAVTVINGISVSSQVKVLRHFDLRAIDDGQTIIQDNGSGQIYLKENLQSMNNSRSFLLLNRDHVVTHVDVPFALGRADLSVPALDKDFAEKYQVRNQKEPRGMVIVELDEKTENITMDGAKFATKFLDEKFKEVKLEIATYALFYGVEVGNRILNSTDSRGLTSNRVVHVFEEELTFDPNLYLEKRDLVLSLKEEGLLSQKARDLAIAGDDVSLTFSNLKSERISTNTYRLRAPALLMGSRHYVTLSHQRENIIVGIDESKTVYVPSEELIGAVIRKFKLQGSASACLIQVNLDRPAKKYDIMAESHQETHVSYALVLDKDGAFYESLGEDSKKIFIMSESQSGDEFTQNSKINIKIDFIDGTTKTFASFCSPNTYLVEQL